MTLYNIFQNLNMNYFSGFTNWFSPSFNVFSSPFYSWNMPSLFSFNNFTTLNFSNFFSNNIWNPPISYNFSNLSNWAFPTKSFNTTFTPSFTPSFTPGDSFTRTTTPESQPPKRYGTGQTGLVNRALSYKGKVNSDREGNRLFSYGRNNQWCADFASFNVYETFGRSKMKSLGFPDSKDGGVSSSAIWKWGKHQNRQIILRGKDNKKEIIANQVKPGDIMILCRGNYSENSYWPGHTAIVTKVNSDGSFETVDGNSSNAVKVRDRKIVPKDIVGFVRMDNLA